MQVIERKHAKGSSFEMQFDSKNMLLLVVRNDEAPSFAIGWLLNGRWCYQPLMWSCRAGRKFWFRPLIEFYRYIRKNKITDHNLRFLAWGENRLKHGGYVVGSESYRKWKAIGDRLAESRKREADIISRMRHALTSLDLGNRWTLEIGSNDFYVFNEQTPAAGMNTGCITVKVVFDSIFIQRITGTSTRPNDPDPFRNMKMRREHAPQRIANADQPSMQLVDEAIWEIENLMAERCKAGWPGNERAA